MSSREIIKRYHTALAVSDYEMVLALHAPDVLVWMCGRAIVSGRFQGRSALFAHMTRHVLDRLDGNAEEYVKGSRFVAEDGDYVAAIFHGGLPNKLGGRYDQYYLQIFRMGGGVIQEIVEFFDTVMFEEAVAGHQLAAPRPKPAFPFGIATPLVGGSDREAMVELASDWLAALLASDWLSLKALMSSSATLEAPGATPLSGVAAFDVERLRGLLADRIAWSRLICADRNGAVLFLCSADPAYSQQFGLVLEADGDRVGRVSLFQDTVAAERRLYGNPIRPEPTQSIQPAFDLTKTFAA